MTKTKQQLIDDYETLSYELSNIENHMYAIEIEFKKRFKNEIEQYIE